MLNDKSVLPADFDGVFRFTNFTDTDFVARWGGIEYTFPALKTTPMIIPGMTPEEVQNIRKKFAKELAEREFYKSDKLRRLENQTPVGAPGITSIHQAAIYTESDLKPFIQKCLEPLPLAQAGMKVLPKADESKFSKDGEGNLVSQVLKQGQSLKSNDSGAVI